MPTARAARGRSERSARRAEVVVELERLAAALEVLVELAARPVERGTEHAESEPARERLRLLLRLGVEGDAAHAARGCCDEKRPEWRVHEVVRHVEQPGCGGGGAKAKIEIGRDGHWSSFRRRRR